MNRTCSPSSRSLAIPGSIPSWAISGIVHFVVIFALACIYVDQHQQIASVLVSATRVNDWETIPDFHVASILPQLSPASSSSTDVAPIDAAEDFASDVTNATWDVVVDDQLAEVEVAFNQQVVPGDGTLKVAPTGNQSLATQRGNPEGRLRGFRGVGCSEITENAVARALEWLAAHQLPDGGWNFDHRGAGPCNGKCGNGGELKDCRTGATGLALLAFLGAGQTHKEGKYKRQVEAGLYFLVSQMKVNQAEKRGDLTQAGGSMYSHGIAAIVLCEAYAMTHDKGLAVPAQLALNHIAYAQDPIGGGWRYNPRQAGDTSVVGWQLMALKSGHMAYLNVPKETVTGATKFLDSVQVESGAKYGYAEAGNGAATTAVGLLCRMYLGWKRDNPALERGVEFLSKTGPSKTNMYYNYYASQVLRHLEGERWDRWNKELSPYLVSSQGKAGHEAGSWHFTGDHGSNTGGRLYCTAMATMILEVYYRPLPIFGKQAVDDDFPLK